MPEEIKVDEERGIIEIRSFGKVSRQDIENSISTVTRINRERGINRILVDTTRQQSVPHTTNIYQLLSDFPHDLRVALLADEAQPTFNDIGFLETVSKNRAIHISAFTSRDEALKWLETYKQKKSD